MYKEGCSFDGALDSTTVQLIQTCLSYTVYDVVGLLHPKGDKLSRPETTP